MRIPGGYLGRVHVVAVINQKGGVGKTTTCANLGAAVAARGHRVLILDLDPQAHLSISFDQVPQPGEPSVYTLLSGEQTLAGILRPTRTPGLLLAPTNLDLSGAETEFAGEIGREMLLRRAFDQFRLRDEALPELVLLDCPPSLGLMSLNALVCAWKVLIPVQAEFFALQGLAQLLDVIGRVRQRLNPELDLLGLVVGMFNNSRNLSREVLQELEEHFGEKVFRTRVRVNVRLAEAPSHGATIFEYAPSSGAAADFQDLADEFARRLAMRPDGADRGRRPPQALAAGSCKPLEEREAG
ncbi:MAG: ParA family protein [Planctomycetota bacterium]